MKTALLIAYHFPPIRASSGLQRTLSLAKQMPKRGWRASILTVNPRAYEKTDPQQLGDVPEGVKIIRCFSLDAAKDLSFRGQYPKSFSLPDRWASWWVSGVIAGLVSIYRDKCSVSLA